MTKNQERLLNWLLAEHEGCFKQTFGSTNPDLQDFADARRFAEKMREQIGDSGIATVEQRNTVVFVTVADSLVHK